MNDRFKFKGYWYNYLLKEWRVFDKPEFITGDGTAEIWCNSEGGAQPELYPDAEFYLCQCTGLKDTNGTLIYEGDIVKIFHISSTMQGRVFTGFVAYDSERCRYCVLDKKRCGYVTFSNTDDVFEVIGNIYENANLLESEG